MKKYIHYAPTIIIIIAVLFCIQFNLWHYLSFDNLKSYHLQLKTFVAQNFYQALLVFTLAYIVIIALSFPSTLILSIISGFLFGSILGTCIAVIAATLGASLLVISIKLVFKERIANKLRNKIQLNKNLTGNNTFFYLLSLRLLPIVPFWLVNLACGLLNIKLKQFIITTFLGIIPLTFVYVNIGASLTTIFARHHEHFSIALLLDPHIILAITFLGILALSPAIIKSFVNIKQFKK